MLLYMKSAFMAGVAPLRPSIGDCLLLQSGVRHRAGVSAQPPRLPALPVVAAVHGGEAAAVGHRVGEDGGGLGGRLAGQGRRHVLGRPAGQLVVEGLFTVRVEVPSSVTSPLGLGRRWRRGGKGARREMGNGAELGAAPAGWDR